MNKKIPMTNGAFVEISRKQKEIEKAFKQGNKQKNIDINAMAQLEEKLSEISRVLDVAEVVEQSESQPACVVLGARILLENLETSDKREYVIMTRDTANPLKGVISNESPLAQRMIDLKLGNTFKFKDYTDSNQTFKIKKIDY